MTLPFAAMLLALFGLSLILITLAQWLLRGTSATQNQVPTLGRLFLIALRLAIGWQCFVEGMDKISTPGWSGEAYLRESMGPFAGGFRAVAGDRLVEKLSVGKDKAFPPQFHREWQIYFDAFAKHHDLTDEQYNLALGKLAQREQHTLSYLLSNKDVVVKISVYPPTLKLPLTMTERLEVHERLQAKVGELESKFPTTMPEVHKNWKEAKADLAKSRAQLKVSADAQTAEMRKALTDVLRLDRGESLEEALLAPAGFAYAGARHFSKKEPPLPPSMPEPKEVPLKYWQALEWSDALVKWSLVVLSTCLLLGFFSRTSSLLLALLILSFYLAMPPLPGWPESPRVEGHYVLINKTLIEVIALLALSFIPTGRWAGIDGLVQLVCCGDSRETK